MMNVLNKKNYWNQILGQFFVSYGSGEIARKEIWLKWTQIAV